MECLFHYMELKFRCQSYFYFFKRRLVAINGLKLILNYYVLGISYICKMTSIVIISICEGNYG